MWFDSKCDFAPPTVLLGLLLCLWMWDILFWWDPTFSCEWLLAVSCNFGVLTGDDETTSFYSTILHHQLHGHEFEQVLAVGDGQGSLVCCSPWDCKESEMTE